MTSTIYYKIRLKSQPDQYVKGTPYYLSYDQTGRIFQKLGPLRTFLTCVMNSDRRNKDISDWEVVELEMIVKDVKEIVDVVDKKKIWALLKKVT